MLNKRTWVLHSLLAVPLALGLMVYGSPALAKVDCWVFFGQCLFCVSGCLR